MVDTQILFKTGESDRQSGRTIKENSAIKSSQVHVIIPRRIQCENKIIMGLIKTKTKIVLKVHSAIQILTKNLKKKTFPPVEAFRYKA